MIRTPPSLVLFDLDGVLVHYDRAIRMATLGAAIGREPQAVYAALFDGGLENRYDAGMLDGTEYMQALSDALGVAVDPQAWRDARNAAMACTPETCARIRALAGRADVAVLTNNGPMVIDALPSHLVAAIPRERIFCSHVLGVSKPAPIAFLRVVETLGHDPRRTLFLDDNAANVDGARSAGLHAEQVHAPGEFAHILRDYGLD